MERCIQEHPGAVVALGAGHTHPTDPSLRPRVAQALKGAFVVLLRPTPDADRSVQILRERCRRAKWTDWQIDGVDWIHRWCTDQQDEQLVDSIGRRNTPGITGGMSDGKQGLGKEDQ